MCLNVNRTNSNQYFVKFRPFSNTKTEAVANRLSFRSTQMEKPEDTCLWFTFDAPTYIQLPSNLVDQWEYQHNTILDYLQSNPTLSQLDPQNPNDMWFMTQKSDKVQVERRPRVKKNSIKPLAAAEIRNQSVPEKISQNASQTLQQNPFIVSQTSQGGSALVQSEQLVMEMAASDGPIIKIQTVSDNYQCRVAPTPYNSEASQTTNTQNFSQNSGILIAKRQGPRPVPPAIKSKSKGIFQIPEQVTRHNSKQPSKSQKISILQHNIKKPLGDEESRSKNQIMLTRNTSRPLPVFKKSAQIEPLQPRMRASSVTSHSSRTSSCSSSINFRSNTNLSKIQQKTPANNSNSMPCPFPPRIQRQWEKNSRKHWYQLSRESRIRAEASMKRIKSNKAKSESNYSG